ncbi:MAG: glycoside hydrolase family 3 N-terminal domain-containing protein [SAR324 cluster bacterium]
MTVHPLPSGTIGELLILGFRGPRVPDWLRTFSQRFGLGGAILFDFDWQTGTYERNIHSPAQVAELCAELADLQSPPLVYVDQEGGRVRRLKEKLGFAPLPSAHDLAQMPRRNALELLRDSMDELARLGIHVNLAPVIDLNVNPDNPDIGRNLRSYSAEPRVVREMALLVNQAAREAGLGLCLKHFPGIGGATVDSHEATMVLDGTLRDDQLALFYELGREVEGGAILVSHGIVPQWNSQLPACLAAEAVARIREHLPDALLISDDLQMQGMQRRFTTAQALPKALSAGMDVLILGNNAINQEDQSEVLAEELEAAVRRDSALAARVREALGRVAARKARFIGLRQRFGRAGTGRG